MHEPMDVSYDADASAQPSTSRQQPPVVPTPSEVGQSRANEFLRCVFEAAPKSRRLEIAREIKSLEIQHNRTINRIKKTKHQLRELATRLRADETQRAQLYERIRSLKLENAAE